METDFEATDEFREAWKMKTRDVLAKAEWRRRKLTKRVSVCIEMACSWLAWMSGGADMHGSDCTALQQAASLQYQDVQSCQMARCM